MELLGCGCTKRKSESGRYVADVQLVGNSTSHQRSKVRCCPPDEDVICPPPVECHTKNRNTAFVDTRYGSSETGRLNYSCRPFRTAQQAVDAILSSVTLDQSGKRPLERWTVLLGSGFNGEVTNTTGNISFQGINGIISAVGPIRVNDNAGVISLSSVSLIDRIWLADVSINLSGQSFDIAISDLNIADTNPNMSVFDAPMVSHNFTIQDSFYSYDSSSPSSSKMVYNFGGGASKVTFVDQGNTYTINGPAPINNWTKTNLNSSSSSSHLAQGNSHIINNSVGTIVLLHAKQGYQGSAQTSNETIKLTSSSSVPVVRAVINDSPACIMNCLRTEVTSAGSDFDFRSVSGLAESFNQGVIVSKSNVSVDNRETPLAWAHKEYTTPQNILLSVNDSCIITSGPGAYIYTLPSNPYPRGSYVFKNVHVNATVTVKASPPHYIYDPSINEVNIPPPTINVGVAQAAQSVAFQYNGTGWI